MRVFTVTVFLEIKVAVVTYMYLRWPLTDGLVGVALPKRGAVWGGTLNKITAI